MSPVCQVGIKMTAKCPMDPIMQNSQIGKGRLLISIFCNRGANWLLEPYSRPTYMFRKHDFGRFYRGHSCEQDKYMTCIGFKLFVFAAHPLLFHGALSRVLRLLKQKKRMLRTNRVRKTCKEVNFWFDRWAVPTFTLLCD